jgi:hypothetical protein
MKRRQLLLLLTACMLIAFFATAQQNPTKELATYYGKAGITKKISELPKGTNNVTLQLANLGSGSHIVAIYNGSNVTGSNAKSS